jgi:prepilin-type processing-associated H-X9-DG protein/prepilin-type N-terminal cleavage/methylation domain-containing protein
MERTEHSCDAGATPGRGGPYRGFTLTELLAVMAVIAVLVAILIPVLGGAREAARSAVCQSNLRQIGIALTMFVNDHGYYPAIAEVGQIMDGTGPGTGYQQDLLPYMDAAHDIMFCPSNDPRYRWHEYVPHMTPSGGSIFSYGMNGCGSGIADYGLTCSSFVRCYVAESEVLVPSQMIAFTDSDDGSNLVIPTFTLAMPGIASWAPSKRHNGGSNVLFCDGHVEHLHYLDLVEHRDEVMRRWNRDNESHPETWMMDLSKL